MHNIEQALERSDAVRHAYMGTQRDEVIEVLAPALAADEAVVP